MSPSGFIPPSGSKIARPVGYKLTRTGNKKLASGSIEITVGGATPICTPQFLDPWILAIRKTTPYIEYYFRAHCVIPQNGFSYFYVCLFSLDLKETWRQ